MRPSVFVARVELRADGSLEVRSPAVGTWIHDLRPGAAVSGGLSIGRLEQLGRSRPLLLPAVGPGRAEGPLLEERTVGVEYGQRLFEIVPFGSGQGAGETGSPARGREDARDELLPVVAPTDGIFYRAGSPGAPPFVEVGRRIREGDPIGLVEVMKTFSHVLYGGPGLPPEAEVVEIRCGDGEEVRSGSLLLLVRPARSGA
jgi:acetyl-CoA carboxylase biotin carboxyl carrier protein